MILLITESSSGAECARALATVAHDKAEVVHDVKSALSHLREKEYQAVILDDSTAESASTQVDVLLKHLGTAVPLFVNFGVSGKERLVRDVSTALRRLETEKALARRSVEWELRSQLKADLTGIVLTAQQALGLADLPAGAEAKLKSVCELAERMKLRLSAPAAD